jgi:hypothetical protein
MSMKSPRCSYKENRIEYDWSKKTEGKMASNLLLYLHQEYTSGPVCTTTERESRKERAKSVARLIVPWDFPSRFHQTRLGPAYRMSGEHVGISKTMAIRVSANLESIKYGTTNWRLKLGECARQKCWEYLPKISVDLNEASVRNLVRYGTKEVLESSVWT